MLEGEQGQRTRDLMGLVKARVERRQIQREEERRFYGTV